MLLTTLKIIFFTSSAIAYVGLRRKTAPKSANLDQSSASKPSDNISVVSEETLAKHLSLYAFFSKTHARIEYLGTINFRNETALVSLRSVQDCFAKFENAINQSVKSVGSNDFSTNVRTAEGIKKDLLHSLRLLAANKAVQTTISDKIRRHQMGILKTGNYNDDALLKLDTAREHVEKGNLKSMMQAIKTIQHT